ncbi:putative transposase YbfD/YdcC [Paraburkholderia sp. GAS448]|uniref:ISAs1 family transposase n=1 Tax=Paraburkholderia sp. GAS448 TaxID=3035136 RepID=UPI003D2521DE
MSIAGKTVRGSHQRGERAIHLVSAYGSGLGVVLGQVRTADKSNEITAIPELLDALQLKGAIVTIDAMGCQRNIAARILDAGADYVLAVKENQPTLLARMRTALQAIDSFPDGYRKLAAASEHCEVEKGHGRIETRRCLVTDILANPQFEPELWPGMRSIVMIESTREIRDSAATEHRFYVSSLPPDAAHIAHAVRAHWAIENSSHWVLDMTFAEDQCRVRVDNAAQNSRPDPWLVRPFMRKPWEPNFVASQFRNCPIDANRSELYFHFSESSEDCRCNEWVTCWWWLVSLRWQGLSRMTFSIM